MEEIIKIRETDWTETRPLWLEFLWPLKSKDNITPISSMKFLGGYDLDIKKNRPFFWVIEHGSQIIGTISGFKTADDQFRSRGIWIADSYRGQGLSLKLFTVVESRARDSACTQIWSYPRISALPAYQKFGFSTVGETIHSSDPYSPHTFVEKKL